MIADTTTTLTRRLAATALDPLRTWTFAIENVPEWPDDVAHGLQRANLSYPPIEGFPGLRSLIATREERLGKGGVKQDNVLVTAGGLQAIDVVLAYERRDRNIVLTQSPVLRLIAEQFFTYGFDVRELPDLSTDGGVAHAVEMIGNVAGPPPLVYLNSPSNPTGAMIDPVAVGRITEAAAVAGAHIILDEVYDNYTFERSLPGPLPLEHVSRIGSLSKNFGMPGLRIGWATTSPSRIRYLSAQLERQAIAVAATTQRLATDALQEVDPSVLVTQVAACRRLVPETLPPGLWGGQLPHGGTQLWITGAVSDAEHFADWALERKGLVLATGSNYWPYRTQGIRMPLGVAPDRFRSISNLLTSSLAEYRESLDPKEHS